MISLGSLMGDSVKLGKMDIKLGQVISNPYAKAFAPIKEGEDDGAQQHQKDGGDHEVHMAHNQLDSIIKAAVELRKKLGDGEKDIPAWIQDHISNAENYITQASTGYYEYKGESVNEDSPCWKGYKQVGMKMKNGKEVPNCVPEGKMNEASDMDLVKNMEKTIKDLMARLNVTKDSKQREAIKKGIAVNMGILNFWKGRMVGDKIREVNK
jgi:hypothetical protein